MAHNVSLVVGVVDKPTSAKFASIRALIGVNSWGKFHSNENFRLVNNRHDLLACTVSLFLVKKAFEQFSYVHLNIRP